MLVLEGLYLLEQPGGSSILDYPRVQWLIKTMKRAGIPVFWLSNYEIRILFFEHLYNLPLPGTFLAKVFRQCFWMRHHGGPTPKRTQLLSPIKQVSFMNRGKLTTKGLKSKVALVRKYLDGCGKTRWQGTSSLKLSQSL